MLFSYNWLKDYVDLPKPDKVSELLSLHAFEVEEVKKHKKDIVFDIDVLPNRAHDCLNHIGMAREISAIQGKQVKTPKRKPIQARKGSLAPIKTTIQSSELIPRYAALVIEGVTMGKSPKKIQEYLEAVDVHSINNIVDLTNFIMLELGQPLHAFDYDQIQGHTMRVRAAKAGEILETLDDTILKLPQGALIIEDANRLIDLAGIKGGKVSGISNNTKHIVLQAANFHPTAIYKTKKILKYTTQAADIYAHGIDPNLGIQALERAHQLLQEWGIGGKIVQLIDAYPKKVQPTRISLDLAYVESLLGVSVSKQEAKKILQTLGCQVSEKGNTLHVEAPTRRIDLAIPEDVVEEIGRIYGYENIPAVFPAASLIPPTKNLQLEWQHAARDTMEHMGFTETYSYSFIGQKDFGQYNYTAEEKSRLAELENPISEEFTHLRVSLLENLVKVAQKNQKKYTAIRVFEIGKVFEKQGKKYSETTMLGGIMLGEGFYAAKGAVDFLLQSMGISDIWYDEYKATPEKSRPAMWHKGRSAEIKVGRQEIGFVGEISPAVASNLKITRQLGAFYIHMQQLARLASEERAYQAPSKYPAMVRDVAVLVPSQTKVIEIMDVTNSAGGALVQDIDVFDMFEGGNLPQGKKNVAFHIVYQSDKKTLTSAEVAALHEKIIKAVERNPEWEVRK